MNRQPDTAGLDVGTIAPSELTPIERAAFGLFDTAPAGVHRNNSSEWRPVTEREEPEVFDLGNADLVGSGTWTGWDAPRDFAPLPIYPQPSDLPQPFIAREPSNGGAE